MMKTLRCVAIALTVACAPVAASAAPIVYSVEFDGSESGGPGTGSFRYDADTGIMTDFVWDFGAAGTGGIDDSFLLRTDVPELSQTNGNILFSILVEDPARFPVVTLPTYGSFPSESGVGFCAAGLHVVCGVTGGAGALTYVFDHGQEWFRGVVSVSRTVSVPEPATIALLGIGLAGLGLIRRRRAG